jgi:hypothetical protein
MRAIAKAAHQFVGVAEGDQQDDSKPGAHQHPASRRPEISSDAQRRAGRRTT